MRHSRKTLALLLALTLCWSLVLPAHAAEEPLYMLDKFPNTKLNLQQYQGKAIFMNFFTEWCPYCMQEMPDIKRVFEEYDQDELQILLMHVWDGEDERNTQSIQQTYGLEEMTFFEDEGALITQMLGVPGYPTSIFIDREGNFHKGIPTMMTYETITEALAEMGLSPAEPEGGLGSDPVAGPSPEAEKASPSPKPEGNP